MTIAIEYPAGLYFYGPFSSVPGMSRPRTIYAGTPAPACPVIIADTADAARRIDAALADCANAARNRPDAPPPVWIDAAQWLTDREIRHAARLAGCEIIADTADAASDPARAAAEARWHFHDETDTLDLY